MRTLSHLFILGQYGLVPYQFTISWLLTASCNYGQKDIVITYFIDLGARVPYGRKSSGSSLLVSLLEMVEFIFDFVEQIQLVLIAW